MRKFSEKALVELFQKHNIRKRDNAVSFILTCASCDKEKLYVRKRDGRTKCFHCGDAVSGWADQILPQVLGVPREELSGLLYGGTTPGTETPKFTVTDWWHEFDNTTDEIINLWPKVES